MLLFLALTAGLVDAPRRTIGGTAVRYGEIGYPDTSNGPMPLRIRAGALRFPADHSTVPLVELHAGSAIDASTATRVVRGHLSLVDDNAERLYIAARVADGPLGDAALLEAADRSPSGRGGLSLELANAVLEGDEVVSADVVAVGQVPDPAFNSSRIDTIAAQRAAAAATTDPTQPGGNTTGGSMTPEQIARLAALRAQASLTQAEAAELAQLATLEAPAEPAEPAATEPAATEPAAAAPAEPVAVAAAIPAIPAVPAGHTPATTAVPAGGHFRAMARRVVEEWRRRGDVGMAITAALSDITESANDVIEAPAWSGELWSGQVYEPIWTDLFNTGNLTNWKGTGWRFTKKLEMADYAGDKGAVPSDTVTTEASNYEAARLAIGVDIDRKFYDFPNEGFITALFEQIRESWAEKLDGKVRAHTIANATKATRKVVVATTDTDATVTAPAGSFTSADVGRSITGAGIPAATTIATVTNSGSIELSAAATATAAGVVATVDSADTSLLKVVGRLYQAGKATKLGRLTGVVCNDDDYFDLLNVTDQNAPKWLELFVSDPNNFRSDPTLARGTVYGVVKPAATLRTLPGSPIRVSAQNIANGGVDEAAFGYWAIEEHHPNGILQATYTPAAV